MTIPKHQIRWLMGQRHVGESDETIRAEIRQRAERNNWPAGAIRQAEAYAIKCHRENQRLYAAVMTGRLRDDGFYMA